MFQRSVPIRRGTPGGCGTPYRSRCGHGSKSANLPKMVGFLIFHAKTWQIVWVPHLHSRDLEKKNQGRPGLNRPKRHGTENQIRTHQPFWSVYLPKVYLFQSEGLLLSHQGSRYFSLENTHMFAF